MKPPEMLFGYLVDPFGALLAPGIFTGFLKANCFLCFCHGKYPGNALFCFVPAH